MIPMRSDFRWYRDDFIPRKQRDDFFPQTTLSIYMDLAGEDVIPSTETLK